MKRPVQVFNYSIRNQSSTEVDIYIDGDIVDADTQAIWKEWFGDDTSTSYKSFREQLNAVDADVYNVYINSGGGLVTDAMAIHDLLIDMQAKGKKVNTYGRGLIASAATYILMAGNNSEISENSWFMIHNVSGYIWGDVEEVEKYAATLRKFNDASRDFYAERTSISKEEIEEMMSSETWMTGKETVQKGFVKKCTGKADFSNQISRENWPFANTTVLNSYNASVKKPAESSPQNLDDMKKFFQDLGTQILNAIKGVKAPENNDHAVLMQSIGEAVQKTFESQADQLEEAVNTAISEGIKNASDFSKEGDVKAAVDKAIAEAVQAATKDLSDKVAGLEKSKGEMENDLKEIKGKKSEGNDDGKKQPAAVGQWVD